MLYYMGFLWSLCTNVVWLVRFIVFYSGKILFIRRVWRYQIGNQNPYTEEEQTTQWPKERIQKDKKRSTQHTHKAKNRVTRTP